MNQFMLNLECEGFSSCSIEILLINMLKCKKKKIWWHNTSVPMFIPSRICFSSPPDIRRRSILATAIYSAAIWQVCYWVICIGSRQTISTYDTCKPHQFGIPHKNNYSSTSFVSKSLRVSYIFLTDWMRLSLPMNILFLLLYCISVYGTIIHISFW